MLAGAGGIDAVLLVVAADESVMPQTREHFEIVRLLGIRRGVVAVTKIDRVGAGARRGHGLRRPRADPRLRSWRTRRSCPCRPRDRRGARGARSARSSGSRARTTTPDREARGVRLPIDRAFSIAGFGPVVTGSLVSGTISREQKLELLPARRRVRVRRVEVHGRERGEARAGERVSANLAGVELSDLGRGLVLATPGAFATSALLTVRLELLPSAPPLRERRPRLLSPLLLRGARARARARRPADRAGELRRTRSCGSRGRSPRLRETASSSAGSRRSTTIGGGVVLDPLAPRLSGRPPPRRSPTRSRRLESGSLRERLELWIELAREPGSTRTTLAPRAGVSAAEVRAALAEPLAAGRIHALRRSPDRYVAEAALAQLAERARVGDRRVRRVRERRGRDPAGTLLARLLPAPIRRGPRRSRRRSSRAARSSSRARRRGRPERDELVGGERELSERIAARLPGAGPRAAVARGGGARSSGTSRRSSTASSAISSRRARSCGCPAAGSIAREAVEDVVARLRASGRRDFDVGEFKEMFGLTRRLAIPLLEHLDAEKVTRRVGDRRELLPGEAGSLTALS